jgi:LysM repeat protein
MSTEMPRLAIFAAIITALILALAACAGSQPPASGTPGQTVEPERVEVLAPIDRVEVLVAESWPPQYFLAVTSGLPNACVKFERYEVTREGDTIRVAVINSQPVGVPCEDVYGTVEHSIPLGSDLRAGTTYTVVVNDVTETFVTQGDAPDRGQVTATLNSPFQLKAGQTATVAPQGPIVEFVEVVEDSRCPTGVECVWAGRARILIRISSSGDVLGFGVQELTLEAGQVDPAGDSVKGASDTYWFELVALDPYPQAPKQGAQQEQPDYTATLVVATMGVEPTPTATSAPSSTPCAVRKDGYAHTVVRGDTLYNIARRSGSSVDELTAANCLADPSRIFIGQKLYIPKPVSPGDAPPTGFIQFYLILPGDGGQSGPAVGCGDSAVAVWRDRARTGSLAGDIRASLEELFSIKTATYGQSGYAHSLYDADLAVQGVTVSGDKATIRLTGTLQLVGTCADARMQAQILLTVFQYPGVDNVLITVDGSNVKQLFDVSGRVGADEPYMRSAFQ